MKNRFTKGIVLSMGLIMMLMNLLGCGDDNLGNIKRPGDYKKIVGFYFGMGGYNPGFSYEIQQKDGIKKGYVMEYEGRESSIQNISCDVDEETMDKLSKKCAELNVQSWNKFSKVAKGVLDGEGFSLKVTYEDGTTVNAHGDNSFPKHFGEFESGVSEILMPVVNQAMEKERDKMFAKGMYGDPLQYAMICYKDRGASGDDDYFFAIGRAPDYPKFELAVKSVSGDFIEPGSYKFNGEFDNTDKLLDEIQEVLSKYKVYRWDGYDESTPDYNDREWFQLTFEYDEAGIGCMGCGDTENYAEVRQEILEILARYMQENGIEKEN